MPDLVESLFIVNKADIYIFCTCVAFSNLLFHVKIALVDLKLATKLICSSAISGLISLLTLSVITSRTIFVI